MRPSDDRFPDPAGGVVSRDYTGDEDYQLMRVLLQSAYAERGPDVGMTVGDLDYWRFQSADGDAGMKSCRLWLNEDGLAVGFAWPGHVEAGAGVIDLFAHPRHSYVLEPMLDWAECWLSRRTPVRLIATNCPETDASFTSVLLRRAYTRTDSFSHWYRVRSLERPIPEGTPVSGYRLRCADREDAAAIAEVNNLSAAGPALTADSCRAIMNAPTYRPELHLIAEARRGAGVAAFCIVWYDEANHVGLFEPVACHPAHHRRGLATALMCDGLRRLQQLGAAHALVATGGGNEPANKLYASMGFEPHGISWKWTRVV